MQVDYIIVGLGLAGLTFTKELTTHKKSFIVFENNSQNASTVAGGVYNPVVLKRFTPVWEAANQLQTALPFYKELEKQFNKKYNFFIPIYRVFKSFEEQNNWYVAADKPILSNFMSSKINLTTINGVKSDYGFGELTNTGRINTKALLEDYKTYLIKKKQIIFEDFNHLALNFSEKKIEYKGIKASKIVFCEGYGLHKNPFFNYLPMQEAKGELLIIYAPNLNINVLLKGAVFVLPLGNNYYKVGATFNWHDKTNLPTKEGKKELVEKLQTLITVPYKITEQIAGIRPTVKDRRPLVGVHPTHKNLAILNGLGTRGVLIAPTAAKQLYNFLENGELINAEYNISRF